MVMNKKSNAYTQRPDHFVRLMKVILLGIGVVISLLSAVQTIISSNIDPTDKFAWNANAGWINFNPQCDGCQGVTIYRDHLEGYAWGQNMGWIRMGTHTGGGAHTYANTTQDNYGINVDGAGNLSGYAWGGDVGWINFAPVEGGVTVDLTTGAFDGYAWGENVGWIHFKGTVPAYNVVAGTDVILSKSVIPTIAAAGERIIYTLTFSNAGFIPATNVLITDSLPTALTAITYTASGVQITRTAGVTYAWHVADLSPDDGGRITITGRLAVDSSDLPMYIINTATITSAEFDTAPGNNTASTRVYLPSIPPQHVTISGPATGQVNTAYLFHATAPPLTVTLPLTFTWDTPGHPPKVHILNRHEDTVAYVWETGAYTQSRSRSATARLRSPRYTPSRSTPLPQM